MKATAIAHMGWWLATSALLHAGLICAMPVHLPKTPEVQSLHVELSPPLEPEQKEIEPPRLISTSVTAPEYVAPPRHSHWRPKPKPAPRPDPKTVARRPDIAPERPKPPRQSPVEAKHPANVPAEPLGSAEDLASGRGPGSYEGPADGAGAGPPDRLEASAPPTVTDRAEGTGLAGSSLASSLGLADDGAWGVGGPQGDSGSPGGLPGQGTGGTGGWESGTGRRDRSGGGTDGGSAQGAPGSEDGAAGGSSGSGRGEAGSGLGGKSLLVRPVAVSVPRPQYPERCRQAGKEGTVRVRVLVHADGTVGQVQIARSSGVRELDAAARRGAQRWRFVPARRGGQQISSWLTVPVQFSLKTKR